MPVYKSGVGRGLVSLRRATSAIGQAVAALAKYGGSLWVADPAYMFTGSDGTGAASDGSDAGYVLDLCGNARPLTQATTGFKPKLRRVPKKLGPELVTNSNFTASSDWAGAGGTVAISGGQLTLTSSGLGYAARAENQNQMALTPGTSYLLAATASGGSFRLGTAKGLADLYGTSSLLAGYSAFTWQATASSAYFSLAGSSVSGTQHTFTQASVREVLEWTWALVFDGVDDLLQTASLPSVSAETLVVAKYQPALAVTAAVHKGTTNGGALLYTSAGNAIAARIGSGTAYAYMSTGSPAPATFVQSGVFSTGASKMRANGVQVAASAAVFASSANRLFVGSSASLFGQNTVFAAAYAPAAIPDAELLIVERAMAQLGGITI